MKIVSHGDNLHGMSNLFSGNNKKSIINLLSAELAQTGVMVKAPNNILADHALKEYHFSLQNKT